MLLRDDPGAPRGLALAWLAALSAYPMALLLAVTGQGLGALLGGCRWIGWSAPVHRQVWALVEQPTLAFASQPRAAGYWLGSVLLPLVVAVLVVPLLPRRRSLAWELWLVQLAWAAAVVGVAWLPLLEPADGHLARWLAFNDLPPMLLALAPLLGTLAATVPLLRLLALALGARREVPRWRRLLLVVLHLGLPLAVWLALAALPTGALPTTAAAGAGLPLAAALGIAWYGYPPPAVHRLVETGRAAFVGLAVVGVFAGAAVWFSGRPLPGGGAVGIVWTRPGSYDNIRPWIEPRPAWPPGARFGNLPHPSTGLHEGAHPAPNHLEEKKHVS